MADFWNLIVQSNTFNFAILAIIIAVIFVKIDLPNIIEKIRKDVASDIENADLEKHNAQNELKKAKKVAKTTDLEVEAKLKVAKESAALLTNQINQNTDEQVKQIYENIKRVVTTEEKKISAKLSIETIDEAIALAKQNIIDKLKTDSKLHEKFIEDSINELDKVKL